MSAWTIAGLAAAIYCIVRGIVDLRQRRFVWGALGILCGLILFTAPIETHAVKYDLLRAGRG